MVRTVFLIAAVICALSLADASAQRRGQGTEPWYGQEPSHKAEISVIGGYVWTFARSATYNLQTGELDAKDSGWWGVSADITIRPEAQVVLLYRRQDTKLTFKRAGTKQDITDMSIEYYQVGVLSGIQKGQVKPFSSVTLGASRFAFEGFEDSWEFAVIFSLGAKYYLNDRIAFRVQGGLPISITNGFVGVGTGGLSVGGYGITQLDVALGVSVLLGKN